MSRNEKLHKLANAIREFRGAHEPKPTKANPLGIRWRRAPNPMAEIRVRTWLDRLDIETPANLERIRNFKILDDMNDWIRSL